MPESRMPIALSDDGPFEFKEVTVECGASDKDYTAVDAQKMRDWGLGEFGNVGSLLKATWVAVGVTDDPGFSERAFWTEPSFSWSDLQDLLGDPTLDLGEDFSP